MRNRFKRLDLIDRVPDELWMEVCDIVQDIFILVFTERLLLHISLLSEHGKVDVTKKEQKKKKKKKKNVLVSW